MATSTHEPVVFFDGHCNLCSASVRFLMRNDRKGRLRFASLQSEVASRLLDRAPDTGSEEASVVLLVDGKTYYRSEAALRIAGFLRPPWRYARYLLAIPAGIRDGIYNFIARNRFRWFGRTDQCMVPTEENVSRFLTLDEM